MPIVCESPNEVMDTLWQMGYIDAGKKNMLSALSKRMMIETFIKCCESMGFVVRVIGMEYFLYIGDADDLVYPPEASGCSSIW